MKQYDLYKHERFFTIKELLYFCSDTYKDKTAFSYKNRKEKIEISFNRFKGDVNSLGSYLHKNGFKNCKIAIFGENSYEWILSYFAVTCGKGVSVPIDKDLEADGVLALLKDSESEALFYSDTYYDIIEQLQETVGNDIKFFNMKDIPEMISEGQNYIENGYNDYIDTTVEKDDLASIFYTSGTTGKSKGVMLTNKNISSCVWGASCNVSVSGPSILILPLHHTFALSAAVLASMFYGYPIYINKSLKKLTSDFNEVKPQYIFAVPLVVEMLYKTIWSNAKKQGKDKTLEKMITVSDALLKVKIDLRKVFFKSIADAFGGNLNLIVSGGAPIDKKYLSAFNSLGITILNGYGITECGPIVAVNRNKCNVVGSVGLPLCCNTVKIADDGEVMVKGDNVMAGYYNNPAENEKVLCDGWFKTGDIGHIDSYGALHITGRIKNLIILGNGENIPAETVEEQVYTIPYVKEAVAYGKDNVIVAEVFLDEETPNAKEMIDADIQTLNEKMPLNYNIGKIVVRDSEFPKTTTKKIKRNYGGNKNA